MAWACVNNIGITPESFLDGPQVKCASYGWLNPRYPHSPEFPDEEGQDTGSDKSAGKKEAEVDNADEETPENRDPETFGSGFSDFEFRLVNPVAMLTADELFSDGKLVPLHLAAVRGPATTSNHTAPGVGSEDSVNVRQRSEISPKDPYLFSPKAPGCTARWKKMLGLKKLYQIKQDANKTVSSSSSSASSSPNDNNSARNLKHILHRASRINASVDSPSLTLPLLKETDNDSLTISSRLSLSSSSSGHEHDDLPRLSLDSDKPAAGNLSRVRLAKRRSAENHHSAAPPRDGRSPATRNPESSAPAGGVSLDSPRMNSCGKIVFHGLERSSSSPSTFNGGPRPYRSRAMERSYSANVRFAPVLNVPVCSLRGSSKSGVFGLFSTQQKKDGGNTAGVHRVQQQHNRNRTDRT